MRKTPHKRTRRGPHLSDLNEQTCPLTSTRSAKTTSHSFCARCVCQRYGFSILNKLHHLFKWSRHHQHQWPTLVITYYAIKDTEFEHTLDENRDKLIKDFPLAWIHIFNEKLEQNLSKWKPWMNKHWMNETVLFRATPVQWT